MVDPVLTDVLDIIPDHVVDPIRRPSWRARLATGGRDAALSLLLNGAVVGALIGVGFPLHARKSPDAISVELVAHMPDAARSSGSPEGAKDGGGASAPHAKVADDATPISSRAEEANQPPPPEAPKPPMPAPDAKPTPQQVAKADAAAEAQGAAPPATPTEDHPAAGQEATPPPPEHPDVDPRPHLVEAPSAPPTSQAEPQPKPAAGTPDPMLPTIEAPTPVPQPAPVQQPAPVEADSTAQRPVQSASNGDDVVAPPSPPSPPPEAPKPEAPKPDVSEPEVLKPETAEERRQAQNTATLAAMLPFGGGIRGNPFPAQSPVAGDGASTAYRGQVYANFNKAQDIIADAKARHLKGQAVVAFTLDDHGGLASLRIAVSSNNPEVDQAALELIRRASPFPPPPPGAQRSFAPAIGLGLDD